MAENKDKTAKHPGGRPRKYKSPEEMQEAIDAYFARARDLDDSDAAISMCGLAIALDFADRQSLYDYAGYGDEFSCIIKRARLKVEEAYEKRLYGTCSGPIFALKQMGWKDERGLNLAGKDGAPLPAAIIVMGEPNPDGKLPDAESFR